MIIPAEDPNSDGFADDLGSNALTFARAVLARAVSCQSGSCQSGFLPERFDFSKNPYVFLMSLIS